MEIFTHHRYALNRPVDAWHGELMCCTKNRYASAAIKEESLFIFGWKPIDFNAGTRGG